MDAKVSKLLIGGFVLIRMLCYYLLFRTSEFSREFEMTIEFQKYLKLIGLVIYTSFIDQFEETIQPDPGNIEEITLLGNAPT